MADLLVRRLRARYRVPAAAPAAPARLDALLRAVLDESLPAALDAAGVPAREEVLIRHVHVPALALRLGAGDAALAAAWSAGIAAAIRSALEAGGPHVVRYRTRGAALLDMVQSVARGQYERAWAWQRLGFWREGVARAQAGEEVARALIANPRAIVTVLAAAAAGGALQELVPAIAPPAWTSLARAALLAAGGGPGAEALLPTPAHGDFTSAVSIVPVETAAAARAQRLAAAAARSALARTALVCAGAAADEGTPQRLRALVVLTLLEVEPAAAARDGDSWLAAVAALERGILARAGAAAAPRGLRPAPQAPAPPAPAAPAPGASAPRPPAAAPAAGGDAVSPGPALPAAEESAAGAPDAHEPPDPAPNAAPAAQTRWGGLLFLLHVLDELHVPDAIAREDVWAARPFRWVLHRLALELVPGDERDPAMLAFAGLPPGAPPPTHGESAPTEEEAGALRATAASVSARLHLLITGREAATQAEAAALLRRVVARRATVEAEPGWIDVRLSLDQVDTAVRRAGIDLDPGWLPWLGVVVRFVYA